MFSDIMDFPLDLPASLTDVTSLFVKKPLMCRMGRHSWATVTTNKTRKIELQVCPKCLSYRFTGEDSILDLTNVFSLSDFIKKATTSGKATAKKTKTSVKKAA